MSHWDFEDPSIAEARQEIQVAHIKENAVKLRRFLYELYHYYDCDTGNHKFCRTCTAKTFLITPWKEEEEEDKKEKNNA